MIIDKRAAKIKNNEVASPNDKSAGSTRFIIKDITQNILIAAPQVINTKSTPELSKIITS